MGLIMIPQNYEELPEVLAPIVIEDRDPSGKLINPQWIDRGVRPIHEALCYLTMRLLGDVRLVSEVVNTSIQTLWRQYGDNLGREPCKQVYARARWAARDIRDGNWRVRKGREKYLDDLDTKIRSVLFDDPNDYAQIYNAHLDVEVLCASAPDELKVVIGLYIQSWTWEEIGARLQRKPSTLRHKFNRWARQVRLNAENEGKGR